MQGWDGIYCGSLIDHLEIFWKALNAYCDQSVFSTAGALVDVTVSGVSIHPVRHFATKPHNAVKPIPKVS